jgi:hypothetical protein
MQAYAIMSIPVLNAGVETGFLALEKGWGRILWCFRDENFAVPAWMHEKF